MRVPIRSLLVLALLALAVAPAVAGGEATSPPQASTDEGQIQDCAPLAQGTSTIPDGNAPVCSQGDPRLDAGFFEPIEAMGPPNLRRYCRCGCGVTCETDADCGPGGSCVAFITCC